MNVDVAPLTNVKDVVENKEAFAEKVCFEQILNPLNSLFPHHNKAFCLKSLSKKKSIDFLISALTITGDVMS